MVGQCNQVAQESQESQEPQSLRQHLDFALSLPSELLEHAHKCRAISSQINDFDYAVPSHIECDYINANDSGSNRFEVNF